jgi:hypothetical protein
VKTRFLSYFNQPYPFNSEPKKYLKVVVIFGVFVAGFLYTFKPFGISSAQGNHDLWISLSFGAVTFLSLLILLVLFQSFPKVFNDDKWTLGKELFFSALNFFFVGNANFLFMKYGCYRVDGYIDYGGMMFATFAVGFFPYTFLLLISHLRNLKLNMSRAEGLTSELRHAERSEAIPQELKVILEGQNDKEEVKINPKDIILISSSGNYIEVYFIKNLALERKVLRGSLSKIEESLLEFDFFFRCHRTHLVNLERVEEVKGNSQGYRLAFGQDIHDIPVARTKNHEFRELISSLAS